MHAQPLQRCANHSYTLPNIRVWELPIQYGPVFIENLSKCWKEKKGQYLGKEVSQYSSLSLSISAWFSDPFLLESFFVDLAPPVSYLNNNDSVRC